MTLDTIGHERHTRPRSVVDNSKRLSLQMQLPDSREAAIREIAKAIDVAKGSPVAAAQALGIGYRTLNRWIKEHPGLTEARDKAREKHDRQAAARIEPRRRRRRPKRPRKPAAAKD